MQLNNRLILSNSVILYVRLIVVSLIGLIVTRIILKNLGITDFGIYTVIGGVVSLVGFINTVMLSSSNRYIAFEIGSGSTKSIKKIFNICINIHGAIAIIAILIGEAIGEWYIRNYINLPIGKLVEALWVYRLSLLGSVISFIGVPYIGLLLAKEKFLVFCTVDILNSLCKLIISYCIAYSSSERLVTYAVLMSFVITLPTFIYFIYCRKKYIDLVRYKFYKKWVDYKEIFDFSVWVAYGALAYVGKIQGAALIINFFFGAVLNSALGIANSVNAIIVTFAGNVGKAITPQITKSYAAGNLKRTEDLVIADSKYTYFLLLIPAVPILLEIDYILNQWLIEVPPYTAIFIRLMIFDALLGALNAGVTDAIFASGKIKIYQLYINTISLLSLPIAYLLLRTGAEPYTLFYAYISVTLVCLFIRQFILYKVVKFNTKRLLINSYCPAIIVTITLLPLISLTKETIHPLFVILISILYLLIMIFLLGLNKKERNYIIDILNVVFFKVFHKE